MGVFPPKTPTSGINTAPPFPHHLHGNGCGKERQGGVFWENVFPDFGTNCICRIHSITCHMSLFPEDTTLSATPKGSNNETLTEGGKTNSHFNSLKQIKFHHWEDEWETSDNLGENKSSEGTAA